MIDIIVAINSINETVIKCLDNVIACTDLNRHRLLLVAYGNNIENVVSGLSGYNSFHTVILRANTSHSAISAMASGASFGDKNDVVLLDTDVIVTVDWIEKLMTNLSDRPETATVSPVVAEGGIQKNRYSFSTNFSITEEPSDCCILIPRDVINMVGDIDAANFFERCKKAGYCHYRSDSTVVYLKEKRTSDNKSTILYLIGKEATEEEKRYSDKWIFLRTFIPAMEKIHNVYIARRQKDKLIISSSIEECEYEFSFCTEENVPATYVSSYWNIWNNILKCFDIDIVHVVDAKGIGLDVFKAANHLSIPVFASAFDYGFICPNEKLLRPSGTSCFLAAPQDNCKSCMARTCNIVTKGDYLEKYQSDNYNALSICEDIFVPSMSMKYYLNKAYPSIGHKIIVMTPGTDVDAETSLRCVVDGKNKKAREGLLRVGYFKTEDAEEIIYSGGKRVPSTLKRLFEATELVDVTYVEIDGIDEKTEELIDVLLYLPNWPVAFGAVISESVKYGIPIITVETGGITERMQKYTHGFSVPSSDVVRGVRDILISIVEDNNLLSQKKVLAGHTYIKSSGEMNEEYELYYENFGKKEHSYLYYEDVDDTLLEKARRFPEEKVQQSESKIQRIIKHLLTNEEQ